MIAGRRRLETAARDARREMTGTGFEADPVKPVDPKNPQMHPCGVEKSIGGTYTCR